MQVSYSERFLKSLAAAPDTVQKAFYKQVKLLLNDLRHPSLHAKKYDAAQDIWQARVSHGWRFYFSIDDRTYRLHNITAHPK